MLARLNGLYFIIRFGSVVLRENRRIPKNADQNNAYLAWLKGDPLTTSLLIYSLVVRFTHYVIQIQIGVTSSALKETYM